jgi:hypothetical protein
MLPVLQLRGSAARVGHLDGGVSDCFIDRSIESVINQMDKPK